MQIINLLTYYGWIFFAALILSSYSLIQPPFEGFDENAHFARILDASGNYKSQFSDKGSFNSALQNYPGPEKYTSGNPPFGKDTSYDNFFQNEVNYLELTKKFTLNHSSADTKAIDNWQYQHPPSYYLIFGFINRLIKIDTLVLNVAILRFFSILLVIIGLFICARSLEVISNKLSFKNNTVQDIGWIFSLCFPMFYIEYSRIGNDSLVFLMLCFVFYYSIQSYFSKEPLIPVFMMNLYLALSLLVKAIVLPLIPIFLLYSLIKLLIFFKYKSKLQIFFYLIFIYLIPLALGLSWYVYAYFAFENLGLGSGLQDLKNSTGLLMGLRENFSSLQFFRGLLVPIASFTYAGSWSFIRPPHFIYLILGVIFLFLTYKYFQYLKSNNFIFFNYIPVFLVFSLYLALAYHVLISMAHSGLGTSGGWYFYVLTPWILLSLSMAYQFIKPRLLNVFLLFGSFVLLLLYLLNILIYAGFITKSDSKYAAFINFEYISNLFTIFTRLNYVAYPIQAFITLFVALLLVFLKFRLASNTVMPSKI
jgi:hypothetical protein